jgi:MFS family permease
VGYRFWRMYTAYFVTTVGDELYLLALSLILLQLGYPASTATFLRGALTATTVLAGFTVGYLIDRHDTHHLLIRCYAVSAVILVVASAGLVTGADGFIVSLVAAALLGIFAAVTAAAIDAGIPRTVGDPHLARRGYSLIESARTVALITGPALASILAATRNLLVVTLANAASFALAAVLTRVSTLRSVPAAHSRPAVWEDIRAGVTEVRRRPELRIGISLSLAANLTLGAQEPLFLVRMVKDFGLGATVTALVITLAGATSIVASTVTVQFARRVPAATAMILSVVILATGAIGIGIANGPVLASVLYCASSAAVICYSVYWRTYRQQVVPNEMLGRVSATCRSIAYSGVVVGVVIVGSLQETGTSTRTLLIVGGAICLLVAVGLAPVVRRRGAVSESAGLGEPW